MYNLHLRIHIIEGLNIDTVIHYLRDKCVRMIVAYEENATRPHHQMYLECIWDTKKLRDNLRSKFKLKGNGQYSVSSQRSQNLMIYVCKEKVIYKQGFTDEEIDLFVKMAYANTKKRCRIEDMKLDVIEFIQKKNNLRIDDDFQISEMQLVQIVKDYYKRNSMTIIETTMCSNIKTLALWFITDYETDLMDNLYYKCFGDSFNDRLIHANL